jgi:hypothetical protein
MDAKPQVFYYRSGEISVGPLPAVEFEARVARGEVDEATLVKNEALVDWKPFAEYRALARGGFAKCAVSGQLRLVAEMVRYGDVYVSAERKDEFFQRIKEGMPLDTEDEVRDPAALGQRLAERGFPITAGGVISQAFSQWRSHFWIGVGAVAVATILGGVATSIPFVGFLGYLLFQPHLMAGAQLVLLRRHRGVDARLEVVFEPLTKQYGTFILAALLQYAIFLPIAAVVGVPAVLLVLQAEATGGLERHFANPVVVTVLVLVAIVLVAVIIRIGLGLSFLSLLVADKKMGVTDALRLSWRASGMRLATLFVAMLVLIPCSFLGVIGLVIGMLLTLPLSHWGVVCAYEEAFGKGHG